MTDNANNFPESWLSLLGGHDASGWLTAFAATPKKAVDDLLWDAFYFGSLNLTERGQLLAGWLACLNNSEQFAWRLDTELTGWVEENWGRFDHRAETLVSGWSCLCSVVEFSSRLSGDTQLKNCAVALRARFAERQRFLGSFSTAPAADPLGLYLAVVAEFQVEDRSLATFWHRMCNLPDDVAFYHARYALLGLRRLKAADPVENGTLRAEVVFGLLRLARAFDRLVRERGLPDNIAKATFRRVAVQTAVAYPNSPGWLRYGLAEAIKLPERPQRWLSEAVPSLGEAVRREKTKTTHKAPRPRRNVEPDPSWSQRAGELATRLRRRDSDCLPEVLLLLNEQKSYAEATGETYNIVRTLCNFASRAPRRNLQLALNWANEARAWEPNNPFTWKTISDVLLRQQKTSLALRFAWVAWKQFPENVVARNGLAEVLKAMGRYDEAERCYRDTITQFPEDVFARTGLAEVLKAMGRYDEAERCYRDTITQRTAPEPEAFTARAKKDVPADSEVKQLAAEREPQPYLQPLATIEGETFTQDVSEIELQHFTPTDTVEIAALVAEAHFYRTWAREADDEIANARRCKATMMLDRAEDIFPEDPLVLAERAALKVDEGEEPFAYESLAIQLGSHPAAVPLLVIKARLERERARSEKRPLNETTFAELCSIPQYLSGINPSLTPLFHFQKGLASLALLNGVVRINTAARSFTGFRRTVARRAIEERKEREIARDPRTHSVPRFYEWLQAQTNRHIFATLTEPEEVHAIDIPAIECAMATHRSEVLAIEDVLVDRLVFAIV